MGSDVGVLCMGFLGIETLNVELLLCSLAIRTFTHTSSDRETLYATIFFQFEIVFLFCVPTHARMHV